METAFVQFVHEICWFVQPLNNQVVLIVSSNQVSQINQSFTNLTNQVEVDHLESLHNTFWE